MNKATIVIAATAVGVGFALGYHPGGGSTQLTGALAPSTKAPTGPGVTTVVGSDQALSGGLGDIQVRVSAQNGKITAVGLAKANLHGPQSANITQNVLPQLIQQTVATNGGPIHAVSGATYTSQAYARSLQAALDQIAKSGGANAALATGNGHGSVVVTGGEHEGKGD